MISRKLENVLSQDVTLKRCIFTALLLMVSFTLASALIAANSALALDIQLNDVGATPMSTAEWNAFEKAAQIWEQLLFDPITVTINIAWDAPETFSKPDVLAATATARATVNFSTTKTAMEADALDYLEGKPIALLPATSLPIVDINGPRSDGQLTLATANAKALNLSWSVDQSYGPLPNVADGSIRYNSHYASLYDLNRSISISYHMLNDRIYM